MNQRTEEIFATSAAALGNEGLVLKSESISRSRDSRKHGNMSPILCTSIEQVIASKNERKRLLTSDSALNGHTVVAGSLVGEPIVVLASVDLGHLELSFSFG